jgi:hypothetical protein
MAPVLPAQFGLPCLRSGHGLQSPRARAREYVTTAEYKAFARAYVDVQKVYRLHSPASAAEICRLSVEAENEHVRAVCGQMVLERAWGKPREYDPDKEAPKKAPPFDPKLYTTDELKQMQAVMTMIAIRQGLIPGSEEARPAQVSDAEEDIAE